MGEAAWNAKFCECTKNIPECILISCLGCIGVGLVQAKTAGKLDKGKVMPCLCAVGLGCFGMAYNRKKVRDEYRIKGSFILDLLFYAIGCFCCAPTQELREVEFRKSNMEIKIPPVNIPGFLMQPKEVSKSADSPHHSEISDANYSLASDISEGKILISIPAAYLYKVFQSYKPNPSRRNSRIELQPLTSPRKMSSAEEPEVERAISQMESPKDESESEMVQASFEELIQEVAIYPIDGDSPHIYSRVIGTPPFSFLLGEDYREDCPPPTYLQLSEIQKSLPVHSREIMAGLEKYKEGGLVCIDQEETKKQSGVIGEVMKSVLSSMFRGQGAVGVSLPVRIFEPRSTVERMIDKFSYAPVFLKQAANISDIVERMKLVVAFAVAGLFMGTRQSKPFNPLLGETFQGSFPDGSQIYVEHTFHNPPTDHFLITGCGFSVWGYYELDGSFTGNSLVGSFRGPTHVMFSDGHLITFTQPKFRLGGMLKGARTLNWEGDLEFIDKANNLVSIIKIGVNKKEWNIKKKKIGNDDILGKIYRCENGKKDKISTDLGTFYGSWIDELCLSHEDRETVLWKMDRELPMRHVPESRPIPSDWRYREDLIWVYRKNLDYAAKWKHRVETRQRNDRTLRGKKKH